MANVTSSQKHKPIRTWYSGEADGKIAKGEARWGGQGYGKHKRPDLGNTSFFIDALVASGLRLMMLRFRPLWSLSHNTKPGI